MNAEWRVQVVPFNRPSIVGNEMDYMIAAVSAGHTASEGEFTDRCRHLLTEELDASDVLLTTSCTGALEMSALLLDIAPGDVVIVPSFTFVSTALAFARAGATIRFADIEPRTLGISAQSVASLLDDRVRAVVPVHYAGVGCEMAELQDVIGPNVTVIEDNAHGLFGTLEGRRLGTFGRFSTLSFHETKNFTCGEGGALVINTTEDVERAHVLLNKGTNRRAFLSGQVDKYTWVDTGSSFGLSDLLAAYLFGQLERRSEILERRETAWRWYHDSLADLEQRGALERMFLPEKRKCAWHMYYVLLPTAEERTALLGHLARHGVHATFHYVPLHSSLGGRHVGDQNQSPCPTTDDVSARLLRLPYFSSITRDEQRTVVRAVESFFG